MAVKVEFARNVFQMGTYAAGKGGKMEEVAMGVMDAMVFTVAGVELIGTAIKRVGGMAYAGHVVVAKDAVAKTKSVPLEHAAMEK